MKLDRGAFLPAWPATRHAIASPATLLALAGAAAVLGGAGIGLITAQIGITAGFGLLAGVVAAAAIASDVRAGIWIAIGIATLLPFAVIPYSVGVTLTLLEATLIATLSVWLVGVLMIRDEFLPATRPAALMVLLIAVTVFAFLLGIGRGYTAQTFHDYAKFLLALLLFFAVWTSIRTLDDHRRVLSVLLLGGTGSAVIGVVFQMMGPGFAERVLVRLVPIGYPDQRIVRFIEDDPERSMRLVSTSVDPNSIGGMLAIVFVIAGVQLISRSRIVPVWLCLAAVPLTGLALLLTFSRGAWLGAAAGLGLAAVLRYRWLVPVGLAALPAALIFGPGRTLFDRLWQGLTLQDPATQMRLDEYRNAIAIIREYPLFGVGFGDAPSVDLATGVSSIYLAIGQQTGFLGLSVYLGMLVVVAVIGLRWRRRTSDSQSQDLMLALICAFAAMLVIGVFDHYFFNIQFPHMAAMFWLIAALILAIASPVGRSPAVVSSNFQRDCSSRELGY